MRRLIVSLLTAPGLNWYGNSPTIDSMASSRNCSAVAGVAGSITGKRFSNKSALGDDTIALAFLCLETVFFETPAAFAMLDKVGGIFVSCKIFKALRICESVEKASMAFRITGLDFMRLSTV